MKFLVFGRTGQVARSLGEATFPKGANVVSLGREAAELSTPGAAAKAIAAHQPDVVMNAAAYTAVDQAEKERDLAMAINAAAPAEMALAAAEMGAPFIHLSTDYVFDGTSARPYVETDPTGPLQVYGASKLAGEAAVQAAGGPHAILRTSWVFSPYGRNFVKTMMRLGAERPEISVVADQFGKPTPAAAIAAAMIEVAVALRDNPASSGIYHFAGNELTNWADFARETFAAAGFSTSVRDIATADYPTPAKRPAYSALECGAIEAAFGVRPADWRAALREVVRTSSTDAQVG